MQSAASDEVKAAAPDLLMVRAGAGAGKTTELVNRVLALAKHYQATQNRLPHLVVTTFTRKATQELKERLLQKALELQDPILIRFVQSPSHLHISTIHGVLSLYLIRYGAHLGLGPQFSIMKGDAEIKIIKRALRQLMKKNDPHLQVDFLLEELNLRSLIEAIQNYLNQRYLHAKPIPFFQNMEIRKLIAQQALGWVEKSQELLSHIETTQAGKNWPEYIALLRLATEKARLSQGQDLTAIFQFSNNRPTAALKGATDQLKKLKDEVQKKSDILFERKWIFSDEILLRHQEICQAFQNISENILLHIQQEKLVLGQLTMSDLENYALLLAQGNPETAKSFASEWDYWLVDEYQDTSPKQVTILDHLIGDRNSFTVGDPQQSIYLFRGARAEVFLQKEKNVQKKDGKLIEKMENYRSRPELLHFFNYFFQKYDNSQFHAMKPTEKTIQEELKNIPCAYFIQANEEQNQSDLLSAIERIVTLLEQGTLAEEICVLARSNKALQEFARLCFQYKIPVQLHSGSGYRERREILDALMLLKFLVNSHDNVNLVGLLRSPWFRVHDQDIMLIASGSEQSYWQNMQQIYATSNITVQLAKFKKQVDEIGFIQTWSRALLECGILDFSCKIDPSGRREANLMKLIAELNQKEKLPGFRILDFIYEGEGQGSSGLDTEASGDSDAVPVISPNRVNLMTVHASKGLQFQHVILIGVGTKAPPTRSSFMMYHEHDRKFTLSMVEPESGKMLATSAGEEIRTTQSDREKQEMGRVLYVALTRAKLSVCLAWQKSVHSSWASKMWRPEIGIIDHGDFQTSFLENHTPKVNQLHDQSLEVSILPEKLNMSLPETNQSKSVTELLSAGLEKIQFQKQDAKKRVEIVQRGVDIHRIFEVIKYRSEMGQIKTENEKLVQKFLQTENGKKVYSWIQSGFVEWGFCVVERNIWFQGQIDLWTRTENNEVIIVDYKTGSKDYLEKAQEQLNLYAWALRKMKKIKENDVVKTAVVYPFTNEVIIGLADPEYLPGPLRFISPSH